MANIRNRTYWENREKRLAASSFSQADRTLTRLNNLFGEVTREMTGRIREFYNRYGEIIESPSFETLADGTRVVTGASRKLVVPAREYNRALREGTRLTRIQGQLYEQLFNMSKTQNDIFKNALGTLATNSYYDHIFEVYRGVQLGRSFSLLNPNLISQLIRNEVDGASFSTRIWGNRELLATQVNRTLRNGLVQGISTQEMERRFRARMNSGRQAGLRLFRTEVTNTYNQATLLGYQNSNIVEQYQYLATLDGRTSAICTSLDNQIFNVDEATTGLNLPPLHPNCRSTTVVYFDDTAQELTRIARDLGGNTFTVPATMTARDFRAIYVDKTLTREQFDRRR